MDAANHGFSRQDCATCSGLRVSPDQRPCLVCSGNGSVLVLEPATRCPRCCATGRPKSGEFWSSDYCLICLGTGWLWTEFHLVEHPKQSKSRENLRINASFS